MRRQIRVSEWILGSAKETLMNQRQKCFPCLKMLVKVQHYIRYTRVFVLCHFSKCWEDRETFQCWEKWRHSEAKLLILHFLIKEMVSFKKKVPAPGHYLFILFLNWPQGKNIKQRKLIVTVRKKKHSLDNAKFFLSISGKGQGEYTGLWSTEKQNRIGWSWWWTPAMPVLGR